MAAQINAFEVFARIGLDDSGLRRGLSGAKGTISGFVASVSGTFGSITGVLKDIGTEAVNVFSTMTNAVEGLAKQSIAAFAETEQLVGGVDKIFGDASEKVQEYAEEAYKTAGVSANQYMSQVTSFSASLLQSLGGDTEKAADYANRAIIDMADNANTFGAALDSIQNAYQGFAKQNYMMLDNLKLGYGGTKTEMERLVSDAAGMTAEMRELGVTVDADSLSFGNIVNAISVMQKHMKIAGTTTKEAEHTISGSVSSMKAAWENFLSGTGTADAFSNAAVTASTNIIDKLKDILPALSDGLLSIADGLAPEIPKLANTLLPSVVKMFSGLITGAAKRLPSMIKTLLPTVTKGAADAAAAFVTSIPQVFRSLQQTIPAVIDVIMQKKAQFKKAGKDLLSMLFPDGMESVTELTGKAVTLVTTFATKITDPEATTGIFEKGFEIVNAMINGILSKESLDQFAEAAPKIIKGLASRISSFLFGSDKSTPGGLFGAMLNAAQKIRDYLEDPKSLEKMRDAAKDALENIGKFLVDNVGLLAKYTLQIGQALAEGIISAMISDFKNLFGGLDERGLMNEYLMTDTNETYSDYRRRRLREMGRESSYEIEQRYSDYTPTPTYNWISEQQLAALPAAARDQLIRSTGIGSYATGGIFSKPTYALIGEAGTEAVLPLENNTGWIDKLADKLNGSSGARYEINLTVNAPSGNANDISRTVISALDKKFAQYQIAQKRGTGGTGWSRT